MATRIEKREIASLLLGISLVSLTAVPAFAQGSVADELKGATPIVSDDKSQKQLSAPEEMSYDEAMKGLLQSRSHTQAAEKWDGGRRTINVAPGQDPKKVIEQEIIQAPPLLGFEEGGTPKLDKVEPIKIDRPLAEARKVNLDNGGAPTPSESNNDGGWDWVGQKNNQQEVAQEQQEEVQAPVPQVKKTTGFTTVFDASRGMKPKAQPASGARATQTLAADTSGAPSPGGEEEEAAQANNAAEESEEEGPPKTAAEVAKEAVNTYNAAVKLHLAGKLDEAITEYRAALAANPELSQAHCNLGLIFNQQHDYAKATVEFRKALAIDPKDAITYNGIGAALRAQKDMEGAIKNWQTAVTIDPKLATAHYNLGTVYEMQKDFEKASEAYSEAIKHDYRLGEAHYRLGLILMKKNRIEDAKEQFAKAIEVSKNAEYCADARKRLALLEQGPATR